MSQVPKRNGWTIAAQAGDRAPDRTQRLLSRAVWGTFAAMGVVRRFAVAGLDEAARTTGRWSYQLTPDGPDATVVTEIYDRSRAPEEERAGMDDGKVWLEGMAETLKRLDALCTRQGDQPSPS